MYKNYLNVLFLESRKYY